MPGFSPGRNSGSCSASQRMTSGVRSAINSGALGVVPISSIRLSRSAAPTPKGFFSKSAAVSKAAAGPASPPAGGCRHDSGSSGASADRRAASSSSARAAAPRPPAGAASVSSSARRSAGSRSMKVGGQPGQHLGLEMTQVVGRQRVEQLRGKTHHAAQHLDGDVLGGFEGDALLLAGLLPEGGQQVGIGGGLGRGRGGFRGLGGPFHVGPRRASNSLTWSTSSGFTCFIADSGMAASVFGGKGLPLLPGQLAQALWAGCGPARP